MLTERTVIKNQSGVVLRKLALKSGSAEVSVSYLVTTSRTPEAFPSSSIAKAEALYAEELAKWLGNTASKAGTLS